jgi:uncharacterized protein YuzE
VFWLTNGSAARPALPVRLWLKSGLRCQKLPCPPRLDRHHDPAADAVYLHLTSGPLSPGRTTTQASTPPGTEGFVALDWKDGRLVGIEILDASTRLHHDLLDEAEING